MPKTDPARGSVAQQNLAKQIRSWLGEVKRRLLNAQVPGVTLAKGEDHQRGSDPDSQDLGIYWDRDFAQLLETWGEGNAWNEIQLLLLNCSGKTLDIACGTGKVIEILAHYPRLDIYGCDISDFLIQKAVERGLQPDRLVICDATQTDYADNFFDYAYSIGSLEHFNEEGIAKFVTECYRIVRKNTFHQVPVSRSNKDEGWIKRTQSYHNNSVDWWLRKFKLSYTTVHVLDSAWQDDISIGKWFVCMKNL